MFTSDFTRPRGEMLSFVGSQSRGREFEPVTPVKYGCDSHCSDRRSQEYLFLGITRFRQRCICSDVGKQMT